jgi:hypothetical protein
MKTKKEQAIYMRDWWLKKTFGISIEEYNRIFELQNGCCAICGKHQSELTHTLCVDHNHNTGEVRGLLCSNCNVGIGSFHENIEVLHSAIDYILKEPISVKYITSDDKEEYELKKKNYLSVCRKGRKAPWCKDRQRGKDGKFIKTVA